MSKQAAASVISNPQGGGALQGIGEKFSPDLHTGTGNFTVPIALPPGRNGFQPQIGLVYSTGAGNSPFGLGWSLSIPGISRKTARGVPQYDDQTDVFILSGAEDLVPVFKGDGFTRYRPRTEGLFAQIDHYSRLREDYWQVKSKDGLISYYGRSNGQDPIDPIIADPSILDHKKIFAWKLSYTEDLFGNRIEYAYDRDSNQHNSLRPWDQLYLQEIRYVDYGDPDSHQFLVTIRFCYEDMPNPFSDYRPGFEIRTRCRCTRIEVYICDGPKQMIRSYDLIYVDQRDDRVIPLPINGVSLLSQIKVTGWDGKTSESLPPLEFTYTRFEPDKRIFSPVSANGMPPLSLAHPQLELVDLFGSGLPDMLEMNGYVRYWRNLGNGQFDLPRPMRNAPPLSLGDPGVQLLDANGDGRLDLMVTRPDFSGYFPLKFGGEWDQKSFQRYKQVPSFDLKDPEIHLVDMDGDGVTDAVRSSSSFEYYYNDSRGGWVKTGRAERRALDVFPNINFSNPRVKWADMTGDQLQDIVLVYDGHIEYWPSLGYGNWAPRISMLNCPRFPYNYDPRRILLGDVDGDGLADLVYVDDRQVTLWMNRAGNSWSDPVVIRGTPPVTDVDAVRLVDLYGNGIAGVLWSSDDGGFGPACMYFLDFTGGVKPYLLHEMDNHIGAQTRVEYAPSTRFYLTDQKRPETRWRTCLPFPVQVVARVEVIDKISSGKLTTEYSYHHGYWDGSEREFRGFGRVDHRDTETFESYHSAGLHQNQPFLEIKSEHFSPPTETRTWFHQGPVGDEFGSWEEADFRNEYWIGDPSILEIPSEIPDLKGLKRRVQRDAVRSLRGSVLRTELYALDGSELQDRPYTVSESVYGIFVVLDDDKGNPKLVLDEDKLPKGLPDDGSMMLIFFPCNPVQRTTQWERGEDLQTHITFTADYDNFGQPQAGTSVALPRRSIMCKPVVTAPKGKQEQIIVDELHILATHTRTWYVLTGDSIYLPGKVAQACTFELSNPETLTESHPQDANQVLQDALAAALAVHAKFETFLKDWKPGADLSGDFRLTGHTLNHYDGEAYQGLEVGTLGLHGVLSRSEALVFTDQELADAYQKSDKDRTPIYLGGNVSLPNHPYRPELTTIGLGYLHVGKAIENYQPGYYADTQRQKFDVQDPKAGQQRGLVLGIQDALGHTTEITPEKYWIFPSIVKDAADLSTCADYDYRVMQPTCIEDPNGNSTFFRFSPLGLLVSQWLIGQADEGGTKELPEVSFTYSFQLGPCPDHDGCQEPLQSIQPIWVHSCRRVWHASQKAGDETIETREFSDGFGRLIQKRLQAELLVFGETGNDVGLPSYPGGKPTAALGKADPNRVVVSGWQAHFEGTMTPDGGMKAFVHGTGEIGGPFEGMMFQMTTVSGPETEWVTLITGQLIIQNP